MGALELISKTLWERVNFNDSYLAADSQKLTALAAGGIFEMGPGIFTIFSDWLFQRRSHTIRKMEKVRILVVPVAGKGTRLRPLTYTTPKNLLKLKGEPIIEYALREARGTSITDVVIVLSPEHEEAFRAYSAGAKERFPEFTLHMRVQERPFGNGHALLQALDLCGGEPVAIRFPDDIVCGESLLASLLGYFNRYHASVLALERIPRADVVRYGVVRPEPVTGERNFYKIVDVIEKPKIEEAPSELIIIGAYVLTSRMVEHLTLLERTMPEENDALLLTDAFKAELARGGTLYGYQFSGTRLDCGTLEGFAKAKEFLGDPEKIDLENLSSK